LEAFMSQARAAAATLYLETTPSQWRNGLIRADRKIHLSLPKAVFRNSQAPRQRERTADQNAHSVPTAPRSCFDASTLRVSEAFVCDALGVLLQGNKSEAPVFKQ
jgi:hypothetical protein